MPRRANRPARRLSEESPGLREARIHIQIHEVRVKIMRMTTTAAALLAAIAGQAMGQVQHGIIVATEISAADLDPAAISLARENAAPLGGTWTINSSLSNRGDYAVNFGPGNDTANGVLITGTNQGFRVEPSVAATQYYATAHGARPLSAGAAFPFVDGDFTVDVRRSPQGVDVNYNVSLAYFPFADGWIAAGLYNSVDNGVITQVTGNAGFQLTNAFDPNPPTSGRVIFDNSTGRYDLTIPGFDLNRDGTILCAGAKDEDNFGMAYVGTDGFVTVQSHDNGSDGAPLEPDPVQFVVIPRGTPGVIYGALTGSGKPINFQGDVVSGLVGAPATNGTLFLNIPGESPATGTLVVTAYQNIGGGNTIDNPVWAEPNAAGDGWILTSRDMTGMGLQDIGGNDIFAFYAFFPFDTVITPPSEPIRDYADRLDDVVSARFTVQEFFPDNGAGDCRADRSLGSDALENVGDTGGDFGLSWLGARLAAVNSNGLDGTGGAPDGLPFPSGTQFFRSNATTGGASGWALHNSDNGETHSHVADATGAEINADFAVAFFPTAAGFQMIGDVQDPANGTADIDVSPASAVQDGVLMATMWNNQPKLATVSQSGSNYTITIYNGVDGTVDTVDGDYGYVYLPYNTENLVAGQAAADGTVISGTGGFTITEGTDTEAGFPIWEITIDGVDARTDGVLLLNATGENANGTPAIAMNWEVGENGEFEVAGYDVVFATPGRYAFNFAYIPFEGLRAAPQGCPADFNGDTTPGDIFDLFDFLAALDGGLDFNGDTSPADIFDLFDFLAVLDAGCP